MHYMPLFFSLEKKKILLIGAGKIATKRIQTLLNYTADITIIAKSISPAMQTLIQTNNLKYIKKTYEKNDIEGFDIVIVAIDDITLQEKIYYDTRKTNALFNCIDKKELNDFLFPAIIHKNQLNIAIGTSGIAPAFAKALKQHILQCLPKNLIPFLEELHNDRKELPKGKKRMQFLQKKVQQFFNSEAL